MKYESPREGVVLLTLNRPEKLNAFDKAMRADFAHAVKTASTDDKVRAVVVTGEGRAFCAGADVSVSDEIYNVEEILNTEYSAFLSTIRTMPKPVIAAINGPAAGIGMTTALTCDLRVMSENAYLMSAFANIGLVPDGGLSWLLTQQLGYARAFQLAIEAEKLDAKRAIEWGLVNRVVAPEDVVTGALDWAESLVDRSPVAISTTKRAFRNAVEAGLPHAMATEAMLQRSAMASDDFAEGVKALFEKRKPNFKGS